MTVFAMKLTIPGEIWYKDKPMPETDSSSPEEQDDEPARSTANSGKTHQEFARTLEHDARTPLSTVQSALDVVEMNLKPDDELRKVVEMGKKSVGSLSSMLREAIDREPLPEHSLGKIHEMIKKVLQHICTKDPHLTGKCLLECDDKLLPETSVDQVEILESESGPLRIVLHALPDELARDKIPCSQIALERIFDNLIKNSLRKGARTMSIRVNRAGYHKVAFSISDDGDGMKLKILRNLRAGINDTDKTQADGIGPGQSSVDHGHGVEAVRQIVMERSGGDMQIFSIKKEGVSDPEGDMQDEQSMNEHPFKSGATFRFSYVVKNVEPNGEHSTDVSSVTKGSTSVTVDIPRHTRRQLIRWAAGGVVAASAGGIGYALLRNAEHEEGMKERFPVSPLSNIVIDDEGGLVSFQLQAGEKNAVYERGRPLADAFQDVRTIPVDGGSVTMIDPSAIEELQLRRMFVCAVPEGVFGYVDVPRGRAQQMAYLCNAYDEEEKNAEYPQTFLLTDTVFNTRFDPTIIGVQQSEKVQSKSTFDAISTDMIRSPAFEAMHTSLQGVANLLTRQSQFTGGASFNLVRPVLIKALNAHHAMRSNGVSAKSLEELQQHLADSDRFIIADERVVQRLRRMPLPPEESLKAREHGNSLCLPGVSPSEAQAMIRLV